MNSAADYGKSLESVANLQTDFRTARSSLNHCPNTQCLEQARFWFWWRTKKIEAYRTTWSVRGKHFVFSKVFKRSPVFPIATRFGRIFGQIERERESCSGTNDRRPLSRPIWIFFSWIGIYCSRLLKFVSAMIRSRSVDDNLCLTLAPVLHILCLDEHLLRATQVWQQS